MRKTLLLIAVLVTLLSSLYASSATKVLGFEETLHRLEEAVESRNYRDAKVLIQELMPLLKEDIKETKRTYTEAKKAAALNLEEIKQTLDRKKEILDKFNHLVTSSPAAVRVRASEIKKLALELEELIV